MPDVTLTTAITVPSPSTGVSTTPSGRRFLVMARIDESQGPQVVEVVEVVEVVDGSLLAFPDDRWNTWTPDADHRST